MQARVGSLLEETCRGTKVVKGARAGATIAILARRLRLYSHRKVQLVVAEVGGMEVLAGATEGDVAEDAHAFLGRALALWPRATIVIVDVLPDDGVAAGVSAVRRGLGKAIDEVQGRVIAVRIASDDVWLTLKNAMTGRVHPSPRGYGVLALRTYAGLVRQVPVLRCGRGRAS